VIALHGKKEGIEQAVSETVQASDDLEDRAKTRPVVVFRQPVKDPERGRYHWTACALEWRSTRYPNGTTAAVSPSSEGESEQEALDGCRKEMVDFFRGGCEPASTEAEEIETLKRGVKHAEAKLAALEFAKWRQAQERPGPAE
jgi:hypothetical protein